VYFFLIGSNCARSAIHTAVPFDGGGGKERLIVLSSRSKVMAAGVIFHDAVRDVVRDGPVEI
jgi:hypothetical protein